jgi:hypothetical protein
MTGMAKEGQYQRQGMLSTCQLRKCRKVELVITNTYHSLHCGEQYNEGRKLRENLTAIADGNKIQQLVAIFREAGLSFSQTTVMINIYCKRTSYVP